ncbi:hypothetical protein ALC57_11912 [Trachymyrmex cornetzi]|uniref:Uncharacterized protein n=1 Tax=Trachymyrmex cornetzi TaxID=471704 RepID=A0A195DSJ9_9HYME|nr:hypothetical protein ALC57_11912 [Trachymyrmex cornetzi]
MQVEKEGSSAGRRRREKETTGVFARKTKGQRRIKSIADKAAGQDAGAHLVSPGEWAFIMMPPGTNNRVHFVSPARGNNGVDGKMEEKEGGGRGRKRRRSYKAAPGKKKTSASLAALSLQHPLESNYRPTNLITASEGAWVSTAGHWCYGGHSPFALPLTTPIMVTGKRTLCINTEFLSRIS